MKKFLLTLLAATAFISCKKESFTIEGTIKGYTGTDYATIEIQNGAKPKTIDSIKIKDGKFSFKGKADSIDIAFIKVNSIKCFLPFFLENGDIEIKIDKDSIFKSSRNGTDSNDDYQNFYDKIVSMNKGLRKFEKDNNKKMQTANEKKDQKTIDALNKELQKLGEELQNFPKDYQKKNSNYLSLLMLEDFTARSQMSPEESKKALEKYNKEMQGSKCGKRIQKILNPVTAPQMPQMPTQEKKK